MKSVRIEPLYRFDEESFGVAVDVTCDCGKNGLTNIETGDASFKHVVRLDSLEPPIVLSCECGERYEVRPQRGHVHVNHLETNTTQ